MGANSNIWHEAERSFKSWLEEGVSFRCFYCNVEFAEQRLLFQHVKLVHKVRSEKYILDNPDFRVASENNFCLVCRRREREFGAHLRKAHRNMALELYYMR